MKPDHNLGTITEPCLSSMLAKFAKPFDLPDTMPSPIPANAAAYYDRVVRNMTAEQKLASAEALWYTAWDLKIAGVRMQHPEWSDSQVLNQVRQLFLRAST